MKNISENDKSYIAGFLDGDGCINAQIIRQKEYRFKFRIKVSITFFKKSSRFWFFI